MEIGDIIKSSGDYKEIHSTCKYHVYKRDLDGRTVKEVKGDLFQLKGDHSLWFKISDFEDKPQYEIY